VTNAQRAASAEVRQLVRWLLEHAATEPVPASILEQIDTLTVVDACDCGCPSVDFVWEGQGAGAQILADAAGETIAGEPLGVLLWGREGVISGLEVFDYDGGTWFPLPPPDRLRPWRTVPAI
jgi:hypothetical protein